MIYKHFYYDDFFFTNVNSFFYQIRLSKGIQVKDRIPAHSPHKGDV